MRLSRRTYAFLTSLSTTSRLRSLPTVTNVDAYHLTLNQQGALCAHRFRSRRFLSSSSFQPPEPPESKGNAIFLDVDIWSHDKPITDAAKERNSDPEAVFVVNGSSRGIGLQVVQSLLERTQGTIIACCRNPENSDLHDFLHSAASNAVSNRVHTFALDLEDQDSIDHLGDYLKKDHNGRVDALFNVAGILGNSRDTPGPERSLSGMDRAWLEHSFQVNVVGHVMLTKALKPLLRSKGSSRSPARPTSVVVNWSARVGSISDNGLGGWYSYRMSKAALNQATRTMAHELKRQGTYAIAVHPGTTDTDLSKPFQKNVKPEKLFPVDFTVNQILNIVDHMEESHSGGLYDWAGKAIPF